MALRFLLAILHLLGLGIGLGAVWARARALRGELDAPGLKRVFEADTWWGIAALIWIGTGLLRAFAGFEKGSAYYLANHFFWLKMTLLLVILAMEVVPMVGLIRWRIALGKGQALELQRASAFAVISQVQAALIVFMVAVAALIARGLGVG
jgi:putative membrane protein